MALKHMQVWLGKKENGIKTTKFPARTLSVKMIILLIND